MMSVTEDTMLLTGDINRLVGKTIRIWCNRPNPTSPRSEKSVTILGEVYQKGSRLYVPDPLGRIDYLVLRGRDVDLLEPEEVQTSEEEVQTSEEEVQTSEEEVQTSKPNYQQRILASLRKYGISIEWVWNSGTDATLQFSKDSGVVRTLRLFEITDTGAKSLSGSPLSSSDVVDQIRRKLRPRKRGTPVTPTRPL